jgi:hypothetical protein
MMLCRTVRKKLLILVTGNATGAETRKLLDHLEHCSDCTEVKREVERLWDRLDVVDDVDVPSVLREKTLIAIAKDINGEPATAPILVGTGRLTPKMVVLAVLAGLLTTLLPVLTLHEGTVFPLSLTIVLLLWVGFSTLAFSWAMGKYRLRGINLGGTAAVALLAMGVTIVGTFFLPGKNFFLLWEKSALYATIEEVTGEAGVCFTCGLLYTIPTTLIAAIVLAGKMGGKTLRCNVMEAGSVVVLLFPSTYLLAPFSGYGLFLMWAIGAFAGALCGALGGTGLVKLRRG